VEPSEDTIYCIDTSSLVNLRLWRPRKRYREVWERLDELIGQGRLIAPKEVLEELHDRDDALLRWARKRKPMFRAISRELATRVQDIVNRFPGLVDPDQPTRNADPYVVALAIQQSKLVYQPTVCVVTEEKYAPGKIRIPHVCEAYGLKYLTIHQMFLFEGWML